MTATKTNSVSSENKALVQRVFEEIFNRRRTELFASTYAPDCRGNSPDGSFQNRDEFKWMFERYVAAFPDFRIDIAYMIAEEDRVAVYYSFVGTRTGRLAGFPATGLLVRAPGFAVCRIANQRIVEQNFMWDRTWTPPTTMI
jgi:steroid delta-isomerase-like uncharacterized protein